MWLLIAVHSPTQVLTRAAIMDAGANNGFNSSGVNQEASGLIAYLNVTVAPGIETLQLVLEEQDPASLTWNTVAATLVTTATGMVRLKIKSSITAVAASTTVVTVQDTLPAEWRLRIVHSAAGNWTYSLGVTIYN